MTDISVFYGILIRMFWSEHAPSHFHARYGECEGTIDIERLRLVKGELPRRALELVLDWAELHRAALLENWRLCRENRPPHRIEPLV
jgi:hypothetical protein